MAALLWAGAVGGGVLWWVHRPQAFQPKAQIAIAGAVASVKQTQNNSRRVLGGAAPAEPSLDVQKQFDLLGVVYASAGQASALINVKGEATPKVYRTGETLDDNWMVEAATTRSVTLQAQDGTLVQLELPKPD